MNARVDHLVIVADTLEQASPGARPRLASRRWLAAAIR